MDSDHWVFDWKPVEKYVNVWFDGTVIESGIVEAENHSYWGKIARAFVIFFPETGDSLLVFLDWSKEIQQERGYEFITPPTDLDSDDLNSFEKLVEYARRSIVGGMRAGVVENHMGVLGTWGW